MGLTVHPVPAKGTEDVVVTQKGDVITGTEDGSLWRLSPDGRKVQRIAHTGGRPLGIEVLDDGDLLVCDARRGLLLVSIRTGSVETLVPEVDGKPMKFCNNAAIAADGTIWFTDSSRHFGIDRWKDEFLQDTRTGRLLRRDPDGEVTTVLDDLAFANGVALSATGDYVAVAETGPGSVVRHWISGPRAGTRDFLVERLPGYPDNIALGSDGLIWVTIAAPRDLLVTGVKRAPMPLRKAATKVPERLQPKPKRWVRAQAYDDAGTLVREVNLITPDYQEVSGVREHEGRVWFGSLHEAAVAVHDL